LVTIERFLSKLHPLNPEKILHKIPSIEKSIPMDHYMVIYGGIVQISTAGMGAQSWLHG
jgi:hypothetical protein